MSIQSPIIPFSDRFMTETNENMNIVVALPSEVNYNDLIIFLTVLIVVKPVSEIEY